MKWAEESFAVVQITSDVDSGNDLVKVRDMIKAAKDGLKSLEECTVRDKYGLIGMLIFVPFYIWDLC
jgi:carboxymethylenebutenolidase